MKRFHLKQMASVVWFQESHEQTNCKILSRTESAQIFNPRLNLSHAMFKVSSFDHTAYQLWDSDVLNSDVWKQWHHNTNTLCIRTFCYLLLLNCSPRRSGSSQLITGACSSPRVGRAMYGHRQSCSLTSQSLCLCGERTSLSQCYLPEYFLGILSSTNRALITTTAIWRMSPDLRNSI